jgi:hypothetical protein
MLGWTLVGTAAFDCFLHDHVMPEWAQYFKYGRIRHSTFNSRTMLLAVASALNFRLSLSLRQSSLTSSVPSSSFRFAKVRKISLICGTHKDIIMGFKPNPTFG